MADKIPIDIQAEIIKHLPIKSLIRCTLLSKLLNAIIKSSTFINDHSVRHNQQHYLLARYETNMNREFQQNHVSIIDNDDNFPKNQFPITVPDNVNRINPMYGLVVCSSRGLLLLLQDDNIDTKCFIWNPSIRRCVVIPLPNALHPEHVGFGVCPNSSDPKLVKLRKYGNSDTSNSVNWDAEIYIVSSGVWKSIPIDKPRKQISLDSRQVVINGIIYFDASDRSKARNGLDRQMIITFDLINEKIGEVYLPDILAYSSRVLFLSTRMESLVVIDDYEEGEQQVFDIWIMKHGVPNSFEKLFTFKAPDHSYDRVLGFRRNGEPILLRSPSKGDILEVYNPCSEQFTDLEVFGNGNSMMAVTVNSLTETLLLIDQPNTILIDDGDDDDDNDDIDDDDDDDDADDDDDDNDDDDDDDDGNDDVDDTNAAAAVLMDMFQGEC